MNELPVAGWYEDPSDSTMQRFWDGQKWTYQTQPLDQPLPTFETEPSKPVAPIRDFNPGNIRNASSAGHKKRLRTLARATVIRRVGALIVGVLIVLLVAAFSGSFSSDSHTTRVSEAQFGPGWPLRVSSGALACQRQDGADVVLFTTGSGTIYGVNLAALKAGYTSITPIMRSRPGQTSLQALRPLTDKGLALC